MDKMEILNEAIDALGGLRRDTEVLDRTNQEDVDICNDAIQKVLKVFPWVHEDAKPVIEGFKRFVVVTYDSYYPGGFEDDVEGRFETIEEAKTFLLNEPHLLSLDWAYVFDLVEWKVVWDRD